MEFLLIYGKILPDINVCEQRFGNIERFGKLFICWLWISIFKWLIFLWVYDIILHIQRISIHEYISTSSSENYSIFQTFSKKEIDESKNWNVYRFRYILICIVKESHFFKISHWNSKCKFKYFIQILHKNISSMQNMFMLFPNNKISVVKFDLSWLKL